MDKKNKKLRRILIAEDDRDYYLMIQEAFRTAEIPVQLDWVEDGDECLEYLRKKILPDLVLLDLNMPRKNGLATLEEMKKTPALQDIPVVVMTVSRAESDIDSSYRLGAASFITKPLGFRELIEVVKTLNHYWFKTVTLPLH
ncbi:MAG: response regulator [Candidatus Omnitrophica bacterium]|nr:response regulator [Candidatus Omnitrophota bacterium]